MVNKEAQEATARKLNIRILMDLDNQSAADDVARGWVAKQSRHGIKRRGGGSAGRMRGNTKCDSIKD